MRKPPPPKPSPAETPAQRHARLDALLLKAAENDSVGEVEALLQAGAAIDARDAAGRTPLMRAIDGPPASGDEFRDFERGIRGLRNDGLTPTVQTLLKAGAGVNLTDGKGFTPLLLALRASSEKLCEELVRRKADVNKETRDGFNPLGLASALRNLRLIELFLRAGADPKRGLPVLMLAVLGTKPEKGDEDENTFAGMMARLAADDTGPTQAALLRLLKAGADPNASAPDFSTPLHAAAYRSTPPIVRQLLRAGARVDALDQDGETPLLHAVRAERADNARVLLEARANPNLASGPERQTPLHVAVERGSYAVVERLLAAGADRSAKNRKGQTARDIAASRRLTALLPLLDGVKPG